MAQGRLAEAERALLAAHRLAPGWARPIAFLARTAASRGDLPTARVWMNRWRGASNDQTVEDVLWWVRLLGQAGYAPEAWGTLEWMRQRGLWSDRIPGVVAEVRARLPGRSVRPPRGAQRRRAGAGAEGPRIIPRSS